MPLAALVLAGIAAALHVLFFYLESFAFLRKGAYRSFGIGSREEAEAVAPMALNQGFYNLFLAAGVVVGIVIEATTGPGSAWSAYAPLASDTSTSGVGFDGAGAWRWAEPLVVFGCACMVGAALVLLVSSRGKLLRGVLLQGVAPLAALVVIAAT